MKSIKPFHIPSHLIRALTACRARDGVRGYINCITIRPDDYYATDGHGAVYIPHENTSVELALATAGKPYFLIDIPKEFRALKNSTAVRFDFVADDLLTVQSVGSDYTVMGKCVEAKLLDAREAGIERVIPDRSLHADNHCVMGQYWHRVADVYEGGAAIMHSADDRIVFTPAQDSVGEKPTYKHHYPEGMLFFFMAMRLPKGMKKPNYFRL